MIQTIYPTPDKPRIAGTIRLVLPVILLLLGACDSENGKPPPEPAVLDETATGYFCMMNIAEHPGPKGQAFIAGQSGPVWFPSVRDLLTFRILPGESGDIIALYVSDTAAAPSFETIDPTRWIAADKALYVVDSDLTCGMNASEAVPFAERDDAEAFRARHGGRILHMEEIGQDWIFGETG